MPTYYIVDTTTVKDGKNPVVLFNSPTSVVKYLEGMCARQFKQTRTQYMQAAESIGHGPDELTGRSFYEQMEQYFNMGVIREGNSPVRTNIFQASAFSKTKDVHGN